MIQLTDEQRQALQQTGDRTPVPVYDPQTERTYFLLPGPLYERVRGQLEEPAEEDLEIPPGIRRSKAAFLRDLPELLKKRRLEGRWVVYHGEERIGINRNPEKLLRECIRRGLRREEYHLDIIRHHEPEPEEIDPSWAGFDWEDDVEPPTAATDSEGNSVHP
jgi:hypothetical protein